MRVRLLAGAALALTSGWALAQGAPESLLPPGFDDPPAQSAPSRPSSGGQAKPAKPAGTGPTASSSSSRPATSSSSSSGSTSASSGGGRSSGPSISLTSGSSDPGEAGESPRQSGVDVLSKLSLDQLAKMSPEELQESLGVEKSYGMPKAARRQLTQLGVIDQSEGGLSAGALAGQDASLVRAAIAGNRGVIVSRWGHILLRRALASRLAEPAGMKPVEFAALRAALLARMGEGEAARALVQDIDAGDYTDSLADAALDAYTLTADFTGICPVAITQAVSRKEPRWVVAQNICRAFRGEAQAALHQLDRSTEAKLMPRVDMLLAQRYAGAAGKARRAVTIEWDGISDMTPWRYGLTIALGMEPPAALAKGRAIQAMAATAPMLGLSRRAQAADSAGGMGVLSSAAMVDLYSQIYADSESSGEWATRADLLRQAYVAKQPSARLDAMEQLWNGGADPLSRHSRQVLTAFAAARMPVDPALADKAGELIASMLAAGLDRNAERWASVADSGSQAWAQLALGTSGGVKADSGAIGSFKGDDDSENYRKTGFLVAGLAGLGRIDRETMADYGDDLELDFARKSRWSDLIDRAADVRNPALVALLAGVGMQGTGWDKMTARHLYHIVSALNRVGLEAEARMIAAEAVARG